MATILARHFSSLNFSTSRHYLAGGCLSGFFARSYHIDSNDLTAGLLDLAHLAEEVPES